jgi:prepilin-type N-terminal cleavage/methylation domain-containing protein
MKHRKAFTLIELLVVIAIIAILAAILFPVFASAKDAAKKAATISNMKQTNLAFIMYAGDNEDTYPLSAVAPPNMSGQDTWWWAAGASTPWNWATTLAANYGFPYGYPESQAHWGNSIQPYAKNWQIYEAVGAPDIVNFWMGDVAVLQPWHTSMTFNGYLSQYQTSAVNNSSGLTVLWFGLGRRQNVGLAISMPQLVCYSPIIPPPPCKFDPNGNVQAGQPNTQSQFYGTRDYGNDTQWVFGKGQPFAKADGSVVYRTLAPSPGNIYESGLPPTGDYRKDPHARYYSNGQVSYDDQGWACLSDFIPMTDQGAGAPWYYCHFRPDNPFN